MKILATINYLVISQISSVSRQHSPEIASRLFGTDEKIAKRLSLLNEESLKHIAMNLNSCCFTIFFENLLWESIFTGNSIDIPEKRNVDPILIPLINSYNMKVFHELIDFIKTDQYKASYHLGVSYCKLTKLVKTSFNDIYARTPHFSMPVTKLIWSHDVWETIVKESAFESKGSFTRLISNIRPSFMPHKVATIA